jgi:hypothetical protein
MGDARLDRSLGHPAHVLVELHLTRATHQAGSAARWPPPPRGRPTRTPPRSASWSPRGATQRRGSAAGGTGDTCSSLVARGAPAPSARRGRAPRRSRTPSRVVARHGCAPSRPSVSSSSTPRLRSTPDVSARPPEGARLRAAEEGQSSRRADSYSSAETSYSGLSRRRPLGMATRPRAGRRSRTWVTGPDRRGLRAGSPGPYAITGSRFGSGSRTAPAAARPLLRAR